ncbi:MAG: MOSC domain-containing protein [Tolypothrix sp. Co-bin9]|nr:MOSC domain-containing protein [Tolypothrix sp. Co-bin9]
MKTPTLLSIQVGLPKQLGDKNATDPNNLPWTSGIFKEPMQGSVWLGKTNLAGDGQADLTVHGGPDKAVLAYSADHYLAWREELAPLELSYGAFGENFTISGQSEASVCIGDIYAIGEVKVQVSQPRMPCWKLARKWQMNDLPGRVIATGRSGWYFRVLVEGYVEKDLNLELLERTFPQWKIPRLLEVYFHNKDRDTSAELAACPLLASEWRQAFSKRARNFSL